MDAGTALSEPVFLETAAPSAGAYKALLSELRRFTTEAVGKPDNSDFAVLILDPDTKEPKGGLWAQSRWGGFYIDMLMVPESMRGKGAGTRLMQSAEAEARRRNCRHIWLDTYAFQAKPFYEKLGFSIFGQIDGPAPIYPRFFMKKELS
ncbi:GNAT family N-acetyltransferase [Microvirga puerhi]|uniref:GNAT family N-acetyltransferase n=1 Tax=Microvirga puerhi TaxID=2876078 RepID=A0ABS7VIZ6_9HYPH|nr:GNAT family N-acetyltransferase [Microvirga puerhi]MBZ6075483.1 GNAT family N-acetyltransferase [Microvirga puerhi]